MSIDSVQQVIGRAILDADFRQLLLSDPEAALSAFHLNDAEI
ncbi:MAG TPA: Os1348 family NHLP clan protein [Anaerolineaceae bacterium]|nr:Os1348 family NHLP clan protein [Anaerolineaceae bacterium]